MPLLILLLLILAPAGWLLTQPLRTGWRRKQLRARPFPPQWRETLRRRVPQFRLLPADLQLQLKQHMQVFLAEKTFVGCAGLTVTDEMRVTIAAQACLLLLNRHTGYFPETREILVYPAAFAVRRTRTDAAGVVHDGPAVHLGESSSRGQVVLSWRDAVHGAAITDDGHNVVIHEFAHQLDQENGEANGAPPMYGRARIERWSTVMTAAFARLREQLGQPVEPALDPYGATSPAEFFADASEAFFERPQHLAAGFPDVFGELCAYYRVNPLSW
ncbi:MAG TPA: M90 family metallopeptidase [Methyloversatilis sp.]